MPRWKSLAQTPSEELQSSERPHASDLRSYPLRGESEANPLYRALAILEDAALFGEATEEVLAAAAYIAAPEHGATSALRRLGVRLLDGEHNPIRRNETVEHLHSQVRTLKKRIVDHPRDALSAIEIARLQCRLGQYDSAQRYVRRALILAPDNRYVLRSASRYFFSFEDGESALRVLRSSKALRRDRWLQATEAAYCGQIGRGAPLGTSEVNHLLLEHHPGKGTTELCAGIAAIAFRDGAKNGRKTGRKLMRQAIKNPTANVEAQLQWDRKHASDIVSLAERPTDGEALFYKALFDQETKSGDFIAAVNAWYHQDPLGEGATMNGSCALLSVLPAEQSHYAIELADKGLAIRPNNTAYVNNRCVGHLRAGNLDSGLQDLRRLEALRGASDPYVLAASGLAAFKQEQPLQAIRLYEQALGTVLDQTSKHFSRVQAVFCVLAVLEQLATLGQLTRDIFDDFDITIEKVCRSLPLSSRLTEAQWRIASRRLRALIEKNDEQMEAFPHLQHEEVEKALSLGFRFD